MTDVNIKIEAAKNERKTAEKIRGAERGVEDITVVIRYKNGIVNELHTDEVSIETLYGLLNELREKLLAELE